MNKQDFKNLIKECIQEVISEVHVPFGKDRDQVDEPGHAQKFVQYVNVPYSKRESAKKLGARWRPEKKSWYFVVYQPKDGSVGYIFTRDGQKYSSDMIPAEWRK